MSNDKEQKNLIIEIGKKLWQKSFVASNDGNISIRLNDEEILTTPTGVSKGFMTEEMIIKMKLNGEIINSNGKFKPSSEVKMHIEVYKRRSDVNGIVHSHPPYATSFSVSGIPLNNNILPEAVLFLGAVPLAKYGTPSTDEVPNSLIPHLKTSDAILLENHGSITVGIDLLSAYHKTETLEHFSTIYHHALQLGNVNSISEEKVQELIELRRKMNLPGRALIKTESGNVQF
jgi:L-fuculose-phosphate aldolase